MRMIIDLLSKKGIEKSFLVLLVIAIFVMLFVVVWFTDLKTDALKVISDINAGLRFL